jgi:hypothetical protein
MNQSEYLRLHESLCESVAAAPADWPDGMVPESSPTLGLVFKDFCDSIGRFGATWEDHVLFGVCLMAEAARLAGHVTEASIREFGARGRKLSLQKNKDYADPERARDPKFAIFKNFLRCEQLGICGVEAGFLVRLSDKVSRCETLLARTEGPAVQDEKMEDTLLDIINYVCLLLAYLKTKGT